MNLKYDLEGGRTREMRIENAGRGCVSGKEHQIIGMIIQARRRTFSTD